MKYINNESFWGKTYGFHKTLFNILVFPLHEQLLQTAKPPKMLRIIKSVSSINSSMKFDIRLESIMISPSSVSISAVAHASGDRGMLSRTV